jgi:glycosyltransferase involved in cell wall biosynthesis
MVAAAPFVDKWVAVSPAAVAPVPVAAEQVEVIPNGIDADRCGSILTQPEARRRLGLPQGGKVVGYVGRLSPEKRIREIVAAADLLPDGWLLLCVGDGKERSRVTGARVTHVPTTDAVGDVWRACDVAVVASEAEGYCLSAVEAVAAGVPLASTAVGICPEIPGVVTIDQPAEPRAIAAAIVEADRRGVDPRAAEWVTRASAAVMAERWAKWLNAIT